MSKKESVANRQYTQEFKLEAVRLGGSIGGNAAAKTLGVPESTVTNWVRRSKASPQAGVAGTPALSSLARRPVSELEAENTRLRRELASAKLDLGVVEKAAAYFARQSR